MASRPSRFDKVNREAVNLSPDRLKLRPVLVVSEHIPAVATPTLGRNTSAKIMQAEVGKVGHIMKQLVLLVGQKHLEKKLRRRRWQSEGQMSEDGDVEVGSSAEESCWLLPSKDDPSIYPSRKWCRTG